MSQRGWDLGAFFKNRKCCLCIGGEDMEQNFKKEDHLDMRGQMHS